MPDYDRLIAAIDAAEETSYSSGSEGELASDRALLIDLYLGENVDAAPTGRSQVTDRSVFETIQWILPSLCRIYASGNDLVMIPPLGPDDEEGAKQEGEYLNWVITQQNDWFDTFITWATDALLTRNAYLFAYNDRQQTSELERYERQTGEGVAMLTQEKDVQVVNLREYPDEESPPQPVMDPMTGQPALGPDGAPMMQPQMLYDVELRRGGEKRKICVKVLPPERCKISQWAPSYRLADCDYFEWWESVTISSLRAQGFDVADDIADGDDSETEEDSARDLYSEDRTEQANEPAMRRVKARLIWIRHDYDEDGVAEMQYVVRVGREVLYREEVTTIPVACVVPSPLPHRHIGLSVGDMVADIQRIKTTILRQGLDNLYLSNNPQKVINQNLVNLDDVLQSIPGGIIRTDDVNAVRYEKHPFVFNEAMAGLEYMDQVRENRTGTNRYFTGIDQNALNKTATGIQTLSTMAAQRVEQIARIFGSAIEDLARIVHELILKGGHKSEVIKLRGQWVEIDPATWRKRSDFKISVGFAAGNKDAMIGRLAMVAQNQLEALQLGLPIVTPQNYYETQMELTKAADFSNPDRFWTDPSQAEPKPPQPNPDLIKLQAETEAKAAELELEQQSKAAELALRNKELETKAQLEQYRIDTDAQTKLALAQMQGETSFGLETHRAALATDKESRKETEKVDKTTAATQQIVQEQTAQIAEMLQSVLEVVEGNLAVLKAQKRIVRGKDGRPESVETVMPDGAVSRAPVLRDDAGRIIGIA